MKESQLRSAFFLTLLIGVLTLVFFLFKPYLVTLSLAATAAVILHPVYERLLNITKGYAVLSALLMVVLTIVLILVPLTLIGIQIATEAAGLYADIRSGSAILPTDLLSRIDTVMSQYLPGFSLNLSQYAGQALSWIAENLQVFFAGTVRAVLLVFLGTIAYYYMLKDGTMFIGVLMELSPLTEAEDTKLIQRLRAAMNSVIRGSLIIAILQGTVTGIGLALFGIPSAVLLGSIAGVGALIPTVGTSIVLAPVIIYLAVIGEYISAAGLLVWGALAVGMIDNFLHPILVGRGMKMHPLFIFFAVIGGIGFFGISGFILGPLVMSLLFGLLDIFREEVK